jgi:hypothetical protein
LYGVKIHLDTGEAGVTLKKPCGKRIGVGASSKYTDTANVTEVSSNEAEPAPQLDMEVEVTMAVDSISLNDALNSSKTITIVDKEVFKATVLEQIFSSTPLSKDILKRVREMDRNVNEDSHGTVEDVMYIWDPVLVKKDNKCFVAAIRSIKMANTPVKSYHLNEHIT